MHSAASTQGDPPAADPAPITDSAPIAAEDFDEQLDALSAETLRGRGGLKWAITQPGELAAWIAEMDVPMAPPISAALHRSIDDGAVGYLPPAVAEAFAGAVARFEAEKFGWHVDPDAVVPQADVLAALELAVRRLLPPGGKLILPTPAYMPFLSLPPLWGIEVLTVGLLPDAEASGGYRLDLDGIDAAFAAGGALLVLCNPYNPVGKVFGRGELAALTEVVDRHGGQVFADEIWAPLVYPGNSHVPYASTSAAAAEHTITAVSASKAWNLPGLKTAAAIVTGTAGRAAVGELGDFAAHGAALPGLVANTAAFNQGGPWLRHTLRYLDGNRNLLAQRLAGLTGVGFRRPDATYLAWFDLRAFSAPDGTVRGTPIGAYLRERAGIVAVDGTDCGAPGFLRLNFAMPRPLLAELADRLATALDDLPRTA